MPDNSSILCDHTSSLLAAASVLHNWQVKYCDVCTYTVNVPVGKVCNIKQVLELGFLAQFRNRVERKKCDMTSTCMSVLTLS